jgi:hypothetical protein
MEVILSELREGGVDMDMVTLAYYIDGLRECSVYSDMPAILQPSEMGIVFGIMNVTSFDRAMAYLTLVCVMDIPEETRRAAVRLTIGLLRECDLDLYRIVREGCFRGLLRCVSGR